MSAKKVIVLIIAVAIVLIPFATYITLDHLLHPNDLLKIVYLFDSALYLTAIGWVTTEFVRMVITFLASGAMPEPTETHQ